MTTDKPIVLKPAKPYAGKPQWQSLRAALAPFQDARMITLEKYGSGTVPMAHVTPRGHVWVVGMYCNVAEFSVTSPRYDRGSDNSSAKEVSNAFNSVVAALKAAGWTVEAMKEKNAAYVYGPGIREWAAAEIERKAAVERERSQVAARRSAVQDQMNAILDRYDIKARASADRWGGVSVTLSLADLHQMGL